MIHKFTLKPPNPKQLVTLNYADNSIPITSRVKNFILNYIKNYSILCRRYFNKLRDVSPTFLGEGISKKKKTKKRKNKTKKQKRTKRQKL